VNTWKSSLSKFTLPAINYVFIVIQFIISSNAIFPILAPYFKNGGQGLSDSYKNLLCSVAIFPIYIGAVVVFFKIMEFSNYFKKTIPSWKIDQFGRHIIKVSNYHDRDYVYKLFESMSSSWAIKKSEKINRYCRIMIDFILTDIRDAFCQLTDENEIRVAVHVEAALKQRDGGERYALQRLATTEFEHERRQSKPFYRSGTSLEYEGFCGEAWKTLKPQAGTPRSFLGKRDRRFRAGDILDFNRSFLCVPICAVVNGLDTPIAVLTIDSANKYTFLLTEDDMDRISAMLSPIYQNFIDYYFSIS
jgi:hypothetical protein